MKIIKINNTYIIKAQRGGNYLINNQRVTLEEDVQFSKLPDVKLIEGVTTYPYYINNSGQKITEKEYDDSKEILTKNAQLSYGELIFPTLDEEYSYKKFCNEWIPVGERKEIYKDIILEVVEYPDSPSKDILPIRIFNGDIEDPLYTVSTNIQSLFIGIANEYGFFEIAHDFDCGQTKGFKFSLKDNDSLQYGKLNGHYLPDYITSLNLRCTGTIKECQDRIDDVSSKIREFIKVEHAKVTNGKFDKEKVINQAESIRNFLAKIRVSSKYESELSLAKKYLKEMIDNLVES